MLTLSIVLLVGAIIWIVHTYNSLQSSKQMIIEQASNIRISLQKRRDLASRIMQIAQGFGDHEKLTHLQISSNQQASIESLAALAQNFPELKANQTYMQLMNQLEDLENNISNKRESYNRSVKIYNTYRSSFPTMIVAQKLFFEMAPYYDAGNEEMLNSLAMFTRDDAAAVKTLLNSASNSIAQSAVAAVTRAAEAVNPKKKKNSDTNNEISEQLNTIDDEKNSD